MKDLLDWLDLLTVEMLVCYHNHHNRVELLTELRFINDAHLVQLSAGDAKSNQYRKDRFPPRMVFYLPNLYQKTLSPANFQMPSSFQTPSQVRHHLIKGHPEKERG